MDRLSFFLIWVFTSFVCPQTLPFVPVPEYPHIEFPETPDRLILIGDVHGCLPNLEALLDEARFNPSRNEHVILLGDLVDKGPDSIETVNFVRRSHNIHSIRGNHEDKVINAYHHRRYLEAHGYALDDYDPKLRYVDGFSENAIAWMEQLPYTIKIRHNRVIVVHAGLVPNIALQDQSLKHISTMHNLREHRNGYIEVFEEATDGEPWAWLYERVQRDRRYHIYFGHDPSRYPDNGSGSATCLDSGCVKGGKLTAAILRVRVRTGRDRRQHFQHTQDFVQVDCSDCFERRQKKEKKKKEKRSKNIASSSSHKGSLPLRRRTSAFCEPGLD